MIKPTLDVINTFVLPKEYSPLSIGRNEYDLEILFPEANENRMTKSRF